MYKVNEMGCKWTLNGFVFSCSNARVNHNELKMMSGFLMPSYSPDTMLSNCMVSHPSGANMSLQWEAQISTTSRECHLLTWKFSLKPTDALLYNVKTDYISIPYLHSTHSTHSSLFHTFTAHTRQHNRTLHCYSLYAANIDCTHIEVKRAM
jgi:hypothetical protein